MDADYPFTVPVPVRFRDLDPLGHVNNAVHASYIEEARVAYFKTILDVDLDSVGTVVSVERTDRVEPTCRERLADLASRDAAALAVTSWSSRSPSRRSGRRV